MMNATFERSEEWKVTVAEKIREKWNDPEYRSAVQLGLKRMNRTSSGPRKSSSRSRKRVRITDPQEIQDRVAKQQERVEKQRQRKEAIKSTKKALKEKKLNGQSLKEYMGQEMWFEEKVCTLSLSIMLTVISYAHGILLLLMSVIGHTTISLC